VVDVKYPGFALQQARLAMRRDFASMAPVKVHPNWLAAIAVAPILAWSAWQPYDRLTWWMEVAPVFMGFIMMFVAQLRGWRLSGFLVAWIVLHMVVLIVGGHYTYARVPLGEWAREAFDFHRNHYDRLGHLMQGMTPALLTRELFLRHRVIARRGWRVFLIVCVCMAVSAVYELVEWVAALVSADAAESFLGTQGDGFDTQADMFCAGIGAAIALALLRLPHDRSLARLER
jgi:putative membrane protein